MVIGTTLNLNGKRKTENGIPELSPRRSRFSADPGKPPEEGGHLYGKI
jgi:hypothetical protein